jgi:predicted transcriptional regulator
VIWRETRKVYNSNLEHILNIFSNERHIELLKIIARTEAYQNHTPDFIRKKMNVTKKDLNAIMGRLLPLGIVDMINDQYELTRQGKEIFESIMMIEDATKIYNRLDAIDILEGKGDEEIVKVIDTMEFNKGLRQLIRQTITERTFKHKQR